LSLIGNAEPKRHVEAQLKQLDLALSLPKIERPRGNEKSERLSPR
jgi:hypothetical protein